MIKVNEEIAGYETELTELEKFRVHYRSKRYRILTELNGYPHDKACEVMAEEARDLMDEHGIPN